MTLVNTLIKDACCLLRTTHTTVMMMTVITMRIRNSEADTEPAMIPCALESTQKKINTCYSVYKPHQSKPLFVKECIVLRKSATIGSLA